MASAILNTGTRQQREDYNTFHRCLIHLSSLEVVYASHFDSLDFVYRDASHSLTSRRRVLAKLKVIDIPSELKSMTR
jgi:hypothetical protein